MLARTKPTQENNEKQETLQQERKVTEYFYYYSTTTYCKIVWYHTPRSGRGRGGLRPSYIRTDGWTLSTRATEPGRSGKFGVCFRVKLFKANYFGAGYVGLREPASHDKVAPAICIPSWRYCSTVSSTCML